MVSALKLPSKRSDQGWCLSGEYFCPKRVEGLGYTAMVRKRACNLCQHNAMSSQPVLSTSYSARSLAFLRVYCAQPYIQSWKLDHQVLVVSVTPQSSKKGSKLFGDQLRYDPARWPVQRMHDSMLTYTCHQHCLLGHFKLIIHTKHLILDSVSYTSHLVFLTDPS